MQSPSAGRPSWQPSRDRSPIQAACCASKRRSFHATSILQQSDRSSQCATLWTRALGKKRAHKCPLVAEHTPAFISDAVGRDEIGVFAEELTVLLVSGEAREAE